MPCNMWEIYSPHTLLWVFSDVCRMSKWLTGCHRRRQGLGKVSLISMVIFHSKREDLTWEGTEQYFLKIYFTKEAFPLGCCYRDHESIKTSRNHEPAGTQLHGSLQGQYFDRSSNLGQVAIKIIISLFKNGKDDIWRRGTTNAFFFFSTDIQGHISGWPIYFLI